MNTVEQGNKIQLQDKMATCINNQYLHDVMNH